MADQASSIVRRLVRGHHRTSLDDHKAKIAQLERTVDAERAKAAIQINAQQQRIASLEQQLVASNARCAQLEQDNKFYFDAFCDQCRPPKNSHR